MARPTHTSFTALVVLGVTVLLGVTAQGAATDDGYSLILQAVQAKRRLVFTGRQDILWNRAPEGGASVQIVADVARQRGRSRTTYRFPPESAGRVLVDDGVQASLFDPTRRVLMTGPTMLEDHPAQSPTLLALLRRNYRCLRVRRETVNGCSCDVVALRPRSQPTPCKMLWVDRTRHALLRVEEYDAGGCRRYVSSYETIRFPAHLAAAALALPPLARHATRRKMALRPVPLGKAPQAFRLAGVAGRLPAWLPSGYRLLNCAVFRPEGSAPAVMLRYGDGLKSFTVMEDVSSAPGPASDDPARLNQDLGRLGQQAWVRRDGPVRTVVRGDLALAPALGAEMLAALDPAASEGLTKALAQDFSPSAANLGTQLRRRGWGYEQIAALLLFQKAHPGGAARIRVLLARGMDWPRLAAQVGADVDTLESQSRAWVAASLSPKH